MDILKVLENMLDRTPEGQYLCLPLKRAQLEDAVTEIRRLRGLLMAVPHGPGKTPTVQELEKRLSECAE